MQNRHPIIHLILDHIQDAMIVQAIQEILLADMERLAMNPLQIRHILLIHPVALPPAPQVVTISSVVCLKAADWLRLEIAI